MISTIRYICLFAAGVSVFLLGVPAYAGDISDWSKAADLICVARCVSKEASPVPFNASTGAVYNVVTWRFHVESTLKGDKSVSSFSVVTRDLDRVALRKKGITTYSFPEYFTQFAAPASFLILLKATPESGTYQLVNPYAQRETAWEVSPHVVAGDAAEPLAVRLLDVGTSTLDSHDATVLTRGMAFLSAFSEFVAENNAYSDHMGDPAYGLNRDTSKAAGEIPDPLVRQIRGRVQSVVVPAVAAHLKDVSVEVREQSILTLAALQQTSVIPDLVDIARSDSPASGRALESICEYATDSSALALAPYLASPNQKIKEAVSYSLRSSQDPHLIQSLLQAVNDQDIDVVYRAVSTLFDITGQMPAPTMDAFAQEKQKYILYWNHWAATNAALLQKLHIAQATASRTP